MVNKNIQKMKKLRRKKISMNEYEKRMNNIIAKNMSVSDTLFEMLEEAGDCEIVELPKKNKLKSNDEND